MPATIFSGNEIRALKETLRLNEQAAVSSGNVDPTVTSTTGSAGDLYLSTLTKKAYIKQDSGSSTSWTVASTLISFTQGSVPFGDSSGSLAQDNTNLNFDDVTNTLHTANATISGTLDVNGVITADGGLDVTATGGTDTLLIGTTNADVITIGNSTSIINFTGTVNNNNVTNLNVTDKLFTINDGGGAASGSDSGFEIEEAGSPTGFWKTDASRTGFRAKAPASSGEIVLKPSTSAFTGTLDVPVTANRTLTFPDATTTIVGADVTQTLTNKTIDGDLNTVQDLALTSLKTNITDASKFLVRDASGIVISNTKAVPTGVVVGTTDTQTLTNKTLATASNSITNTLNYVGYFGGAGGSLTGEATLNPNRGGTGHSNNSTLIYGPDDVTFITVGTTSVTLPTSGTLISTTAATFTDNTFIIQDNIDNTKRAKFFVDNIATGTTITFAFPGVSADDTLVTNQSTSILLNKTFRDAFTTFTDQTDTTKAFQFEASGITTGQTRTYTVPDANTTLVGTGVTQTLTNKTLVDGGTSFVDNIDNTKVFVIDVAGATASTTTLISASTSTRNITLPDVTDTIVARTSTDTGSNRLQNKDLSDNNVNFVDESDTTKKLNFSLGGATTGTTTTFVSSQTANRSLTLPDATTTLVGTNATQTLTNKTLTIDDNKFTIQNSSDNTKKVNFIVNNITTGTTRTYQFPNADSQTLVGTSVAQQLLNKDFPVGVTIFEDDTDSTKEFKFLASGISTGTTRILTVPDADLIIVGTTTSQTLTNKNLIVDTTLFKDGTDNSKTFKFTASTITTATTRTLTVPDADLTIVGTTTTQTLTNKTLSGNIATNLINGAGTINFNSTGTITVPNATDTLVGKNTTDTLTNKTLDNTNTVILKDTLFTIQDDGDTTKQAKFQASGITTATTRTYTFPDASGTLSLDSTGDISQTSFTAADNQAAAANVTGLAFANASVRSFNAILSVTRGTTYANYQLNGIQKAASWEISQSYVGDDTGLVFTITTAGQVQYQSSSTGNTALLKFRANVTSV